MIAEKTFKKYAGSIMESRAAYTREVEREVLDNVVERFEQIYTSDEMSKSIRPILDMIREDVKADCEGELGTDKATDKSSIVSTEEFFKGLKHLGLF